MMKLRKRSRAAFAAILSCALVFGLSVSALASGVISNNPLDNISTVTLSDSGGALKFTMNREDTDLFANFKGVMPGDTLGQIVRVATQAGNSSDYNIYLYARVHQAEQEAPAAAALSAEAGSNAHGNPSLHNLDFWQQLKLTVTIDGVTSDLMAAGPGIAGVHLGRFVKSGVSKDVQVKLEVPIEMGNEFAEQNAYIDWFFYAQGIDNPGPGPDDPDPKPKPDPDPVKPPVIEVPEEDVPLNPLDPETEVDVPDEEVPLDALTPTSAIPQTGDESHMALWATLTVLSGGTLVFLATGLKKKD